MSEQPLPVDPPVIEVTVAAPVAVVWDALRDRDQLRRWHGWDDPGLDAEIEVIFFQDVTEDREGGVLQLGDRDRFELADVGGATRVRIVRGPLDPTSDWAAYYDDITEGWTSFLQQLRFALERHPGEERRTLMRSGAPVDGGTVVDRLGLTALRDRPAGERYSIDTPVEPLAGTIWFVSERQLGLTVDGFGDGLLIAGHEHPAGHRPHGGAMVLITTYGLDDAGFDAVRARWDAWSATALIPAQPAEQPPVAVGDA